MFLFVEAKEGVLIVYALFIQRLRVSLENPFGAGESARLSASLFLSSISVAAGRRPVGRAAGQ